MLQMDRPNVHDMDKASALPRDQKLTATQRVLAGVGAVAAAFVAFWAAFIGTIVFHDCFIKCIPAEQDPAPLLGSLIYLGAGAATTVAVTLATLALAGRRPLGRRAGTIAAVVASLLVVLTIATQWGQLP